MSKMPYTSEPWSVVFIRRFRLGHGRKLPGWMIALIPALAISSTLSRQCRPGANRSVRTAPSRRSLAWSLAIRTDATRLVWPGHRSRGHYYNDPIWLTYLIAFQANSRAVASVSVGWRFVTTRQLTYFHLVFGFLNETTNTSVFWPTCHILSIKWQS